MMTDVDRCDLGKIRSHTSSRLLTQITRRADRKRVRTAVNTQLSSSVAFGLEKSVLL